MSAADKACNGLSDQILTCTAENKQLEEALEKARQRGSLTGAQEAFGKEFLDTVAALLNL